MDKLVNLFKNRSARTAIASLSIALVVFLVFTFFFLTKTTASTSGSSENASLTVSDETDNLVHYSVCTGYCGPKIKESAAQQNVIFYANTTNSSGSVINSSNGNGNATIKFNENGTWTTGYQMEYNSTSTLWEYTNNFSYKGNINSSVNLTSNYGNITLFEAISITNTPPYIVKDTGGFVSFDGGSTKGVLQCVEDTLCTYNFSANVSEDDKNDVLTFNYTSSANTTLTNFTINSTTGILIVNYSTTLDVGSNSSVSRRIEMNVRDTESQTLSAILDVNVTAVNDAPYFLNLGSARQLNKSAFVLILQAADEENDINYTFNVSFLNCVHRANNPPTGPANCTLFNLTYFNATATNISFTPADNQKGEYEINFSVKDSRNATYSTVINWTVTWNEIPYFTYVCNNERNTTENLPFSCYINASDVDELYNLTFKTNYTWFTFNGTASNSTTITTSGGNASALVNFTSTDSSVGNWSVNITVIDTGAQNETSRSNSTVINFFIDNVNDTVDLSAIPDQIGYTSINKTLSINATDDDLLIPDKSVYNESLTFTSNNSNVTVQTTVYVSDTNRTTATLLINTLSLGTGNHSINITVRDANNFSIDSDVFMVNITGNTAPQWNSSTPNYFVLNEDVAFSYNLTANVTDDAGETLSFSATINGVSDYPFDQFSLNASTGVMNFTPIDEDVGYHNITITVTDGKTPVSREYNFTVYNNYSDIPAFSSFTPLDNVTVNETSREIVFQEDNYTRFQIYVTDDDLLIPDNQVSQYGFYNEILTINITLQGRNTTLLTPESFTYVSGLSLAYQTYILTPRKGDVGQYNFTFNITDAYNNSFTRSYNLTVLETGHPPVLTDISNQVLSILNDNLYIDVNGSDLEDGNDSISGGNLTFTLTALTSGGNFLTINSTTGVMNFTFNQTYAGLWQYYLAVNDTVNNTDFDYFNVTVYDYPAILFPNSSYTFSLQENVTSFLNFSTNHTVQDNLTYSIYISGSFRNSTSGYGNSSEFLFSFMPNFTDETTCTGALNLTLNVSNAKLSNTTSWLVTINHTNYPLSFTSTIPAQSGGSPLILYLSSYFSDIDASDSCINQTVLFSYALVPNSTSGGTITVGFQNWINSSTPLVNFSSTVSASGNYSLTAAEYNASNSSQPINNVSSNNFSVTLTYETSETPTTGGGGGGGGSSTVEKIVSLKILVPEPVSAKHGDRLVIPLGLVNDGVVDLRDIVLSAVIAKDGLLRRDLIASFDKSVFERLDSGDRENVTLIVDIDTNATGLFEVTINATVEEPEYSDWAKFYIEIEKDEDVLERIIFTEEFIIGNPECAEFVDLINEAKALFTLGKLKDAMQKANDSLDACRQAITQPPRPRLYQKIGGEFFTYAAIASFIAFVLGFIYYEYKKILLRRQLRGY